MVPSKHYSSPVDLQTWSSDPIGRYWPADTQMAGSQDPKTIPASRQRLLTPSAITSRPTASQQGQESLPATLLASCWPLPIGRQLASRVKSPCQQPCWPAVGHYQSADSWPAGSRVPASNPVGQLSAISDWPTAGQQGQKSLCQQPCWPAVGHQNPSPGVNVWVNCRILSSGKTEWRLISATLCG